MTGLLDSYLGRYYSSTVIGNKSGVDPIKELRQAMKNNQQLKEDAQKRWAELEKVDDNRCFISKTQKKFLREVLNGR